MSSEEDCFKTQVSCTRAGLYVYIWAKFWGIGNSSGRFLDIGFWMGAKDFPYRWPHILFLFLRCQRQGLSYKTVVFFIFLLTFVLFVVFRPILDFLVLGKCCKIKAGLVSLCLDLCLIDTWLQDLKRVQTCYYSVPQIKKLLFWQWMLEKMFSSSSLTKGQKKNRKQT